MQKVFLNKASKNNGRTSIGCDPRILHEKICARCSWRCFKLPFRQLIRGINGIDHDRRHSILFTHVSIIIIIIIIIIIMALELLVGLGRFFSLFIIYTVGRISWTGDQQLSTHRTTQIQNKRLQHRYPCLEWDLNRRSQCLSGRRRFMS
jgi:hypothetical protein